MTEAAGTRQAADADWPAIGQLLARAFLTGGDSFAGLKSQFPARRGLVVASGGRVIAHAGSAGRELAVPGGTASAAHVALVAVDPMYRRQGLLTALMRRQLGDLRENGQDPIAVLWASEGRIYHRYGYGLASYAFSLAADLREIRLLDNLAAGCELTEVQAAVAIPDIRGCYELTWRHRPGWSSRAALWDWGALAGQTRQPNGADQRRIVLAAGAGGAEGYAVWQPAEHWTELGPDCAIELHELVAASPEAAAALWRFLLSLDLARTLRYALAAADDPVLHLVDEPRRLRALVTDALWVRLIEVGQALSGRRYLTPVDEVIKVSDPVLPANSGSWRLCGDLAGATCTRTGATAGIALSIAELGAAYLGGTPLSALAAAGRVKELRRGAVAAVSAAFGWHRQPSALERF